MMSKKTFLCTGSLCKKTSRNLVPAFLLQERVGAVLRHDAVGLALLSLVLRLKLVADIVILLGKELLSFEGGYTSRSCLYISFLFQSTEKG